MSEKIKIGKIVDFSVSTLLDNRLNFFIMDLCFLGIEIGSVSLGPATIYEMNED